MTKDLPGGDIPVIDGRLFIARHGETVYNAARRMQGSEPHTPLTRTGFTQANAMGVALQKWLGTYQVLELWCSPAGRAQQTLAVMIDHFNGDFHETMIDERLREIDTGSWGGRYYAEIHAAEGDFLCAQSGLFTQVPDGGESYGDVAARLCDWLAALPRNDADRLVVMHGMSSRVLRGLLLGLDPDPRFGVPIAPSVPQGSLVMIASGTEKAIHIDAAGTRE